MAGGGAKTTIHGKPLSPEHPRWAVYVTAERGSSSGQVP